MTKVFKDYCGNILSIGDKVTWSNIDNAKTVRSEYYGDVVEVVKMDDKYIYVHSEKQSTCGGWWGENFEKIMEEDKMNEFDIGDVVNVIDTGGNFSTYPDFATKHGMKNYVGYTHKLDNPREEFKVVAVGEHRYSSYGIVYGIENAKGESFILMPSGLRLVKKADMLGVGDLVKVLSDKGAYGLTPYVGKTLVITEHAYKSLEYKRQIFRVAEVGGTTIHGSGGWPDMFQLVAKTGKWNNKKAYKQTVKQIKEKQTVNSKHKFKVGDVVEVIQNTTSHFFKIGEHVKITEIGMVDTIKPYYRAKDILGHIWNIYEADVQAIKLDFTKPLTTAEGTPVIVVTTQGRDEKFPVLVYEGAAKILTKYSLDGKAKNKEARRNLVYASTKDVEQVEFYVNVYDNKDLMYPKSIGNTRYSSEAEATETFERLKARNYDGKEAKKRVAVYKVTKIITYK